MASNNKDLIEGLLRQVKKQHRIRILIEKALDGVIDAQTRGGISLECIQKKSVILNANSSAALYNTNLKKEDILKALKKHIPTINKIVIKLH